MYVAKCPLRVSLVGGSTDLESFIQKYDRGSVISFPSSLYVYIAIHENNRNKYIINYSKREEVELIEEIHNDVAREVLNYFNIGPCTISFNSDIFSHGSGLASSTAYMIAATKAVSEFSGNYLSNFEICRIALELERRFNPLTGYQDSYGCGIGGFKRIDFSKNQRPSFRYLENHFLESNFDLFLIHTGVVRSATKILKGIDIDKSKILLSLVDEMEQCIASNNVDEFLRVFNLGWQQKKNTSKEITNNELLIKLDKALSADKDVLGVKLCGAGAGGYFLVLTETKKGKSVKRYIKSNFGLECIDIHIDSNGTTGLFI